MNIHHLELFYHVARYGGISEGVRNIPYGLQQPAMSGQIIQLEESLGLTLFQRRPFALTPPGEELYQFIKPFFDNLQPMADNLRGGVSQRVRSGASEVVLRDYLPGLLQAMQKKFPKLKSDAARGLPAAIGGLAGQTGARRSDDLVGRQTAERRQSARVVQTAAGPGGRQKQQDQIRAGVVRAGSDRGDADNLADQ